ncbi:Slp family lipoprotein [Thiorhodovibrio frisius]|uniref:Slp family lipoprotein n=1 Tax=Thiorhodovibrio frisius TaxID=631362 RepID=UPI0003177F44|nr:Slp family lipoprotein [Thiorhodovibrio frisius]
MNLASLAAMAFCALLMLGGCASDGGYCPSTLTNPYPSPAAMQGLPPEDVRLGEHLTWGGILIDARHLASTTELDISARPLDAACQVRNDVMALGRFRVRYPGYFETADLIPGQPLRVSGRLAAMETRSSTGERIPVVTEATLHGLARASAARVDQNAVYRPRIGISIGAGSGWSGGGIGISF